MIGSLVGLLLLFMARAVRLRIDAAYFGVILLLSIGAVVSVLKGFDWQESTVLASMLVLFLPTRRFFYRKSSLLSMSFSAPWLAFVCIIILGAIWIGLFSYKHVQYSHDLWWQFAYKADSSRFLRSSLTIVVVLICFASYRLLRVSPERGQLPSGDEIDALESIVHVAPESQSYLALLGDKYILWSDSRKSFLMYERTSRYWIAMGDPAGIVEEYEELAWRFRESADKNGAQIAFYQVSNHNLGLYLDLGLVLIKLGEEAHVALDDFSLEGSKRSKLRQTNTRFTKMGLNFEVLEQAQVIARMAELKRVSDSWLSSKSIDEKGFSLGFFSADYLRRTRVATITLDDRILAFANLWETGNRNELSIDLMRYSLDAPGGVMKYLLIQLMLWGKSEGYHSFNLGMAPLAGLDKNPLAPLWHKIGNIIFELSDDFYSFDGLQAYKDKFDPVWQARYLASPALKTPSVLLHIATIIAGSWKGIFGKQI